MATTMNVATDSLATATGGHHENGRPASLSVASPPEHAAEHAAAKKKHRTKTRVSSYDETDEDNQTTQDEDTQHSADSYSPITDLRCNVVATWLQQFYEPKEDISLPRSALYDHYIEACARGEAGSDAVNSATFGKVIRAVFPSVGTRRLGTRGHSKYHYYGIGLRDEAIAQVPGVFCQYAVPRQHPSPKSGSASASMSASRSISHGSASSMPTDECAAGSSKQPAVRRVRPKKFTRSTNGSNTTSVISSHASSRSRMASSGAASCANGLPPNYDEFAKFIELLCLSIATSDSRENTDGAFMGFCAALQEHQTQILRLICGNEFGLVERAMSLFWHQLPAEWGPVLHDEHTLRIVANADDHLYQTALVSLIADVLEPVPIAANQAIRQFSKHFETQMQAVMSGSAACCPQSIRDAKLEAAHRFCQCLRRRTALNHLSQAVDGILRNVDLGAMLLRDWSHVDLAGIREQAGWIMRMRDAMVTYVDDSFKAYLQEGAPLHIWASWIESMAEQCLSLEMAALQQSGGSATAEETEAIMETSVRTLFYRWAFFGTMVIRDLTLRSANSFGSFHLIKLWMDEYLFFYLEHKLEEYRRTLGMLALYSQGFLSEDILTHQTGHDGNAATNSASLYDWTSALMEPAAGSILPEDIFKKYSSDQQPQQGGYGLPRPHGIRP